MGTYVRWLGQKITASRLISAKTGFAPLLPLHERLVAHRALAGIFVASALRTLPAQLDLFTAIAGGGGIGGIMGGAVAWLLEEDLAQGGVIGGVLGMILGALLAILQSWGLYS